MAKNSSFSNGVMLNAYPDSIGTNLKGAISMLQNPAFKDVFSLFYVLPTFFNSDLDRGFSIIDYNINKELVSDEDLESLKKLGIELKFDIVLNHLSVASPQFKDLIAKGDNSKYKDFFINWNDFWKGHGTLGEDGIMRPNAEHLSKLFMRKPGLPILKVLFPDGTERPYWNTFYQKITFAPLAIDDLKFISGITDLQKEEIVTVANDHLLSGKGIDELDLKKYSTYEAEIKNAINKNRNYLGQMDVNANSELVWDYYENVLAKVKDYGCKILRLDAFAYLHKEIGQSNFFNKPGTWDHLERINSIAQSNELQLLPEIHAEYGLHLHDEVASKGYVIYDFFLSGLIIHAIEKGTNNALVKWAEEIIEKEFKTVNMLGCHDGIPMLDLRGKEVNGVYNQGLLKDKEIEEVIEIIMSRGGRVKNLYGPSGKKISYYQVNATYYSALGEDDQKMLLARAIQLFMPGVPQVWYLDLFAGTNDYTAADQAGKGGHKEINRTNLSAHEISEGLKKKIVLDQLELLRLRNTSKAFDGTMDISKTTEHKLDIKWINDEEEIELNADLKNYTFCIKSKIEGVVNELVF